MDTNLNLLGTIGKGGQGPEEFGGIGCLAVYEDTVMAINGSGVSLNRYTKSGRFIDRCPFSDPSLMVNNFCVDNDGFLYFTSKSDSFPVMKYDRKMNRLYGFGEWIDPENKERHILNDYLISYFNDKILLVQTDAPVINLYEKDGQHLLKKELPVELFEKRLNFKKREQEKDPSSVKKVYMLFSSVTSFKNKVYLLYIDHDNMNIPFNSKIVELLYENGDFIINKAYSLAQPRKGWFFSILAINDSTIIASNGSDVKLCVYKLNGMEP